MTDINVLNNSKCDILINLGKFKFLTIKNILQLGILTTRNNTYLNLKELLELPRPLIKRLKFAVTPTLGQLHDVYYLTKRGAKCVAEYLRVDESEIKFPLGNTLFGRDYFHRIHTIEFLIEYDKFIKQNEDLISLAMYSYFDNFEKEINTSRYVPKTKINIPSIGNFIPDGVFLFKNVLTKENYLFTFELFNGLRTGLVLNQVCGHIEALKLGLISQKFNLHQNHYIVFVFEKNKTKELIKKYLANNNDLNKRFLLSSLENIKNDFINAWENFKGEKIKFCFLK